MRLVARDLEKEKNWARVEVKAPIFGEDRKRMLPAGFQAHVPKPVDAADFVAAVANLAGRIIAADAGAALKTA